MIKKVIWIIVAVIAFIAGMLVVSDTAFANHPPQVGYRLSQFLQSLGAHVDKLESDTTLADLSCSSDQVARWTGAEWTCNTIVVTSNPIKTVDVGGGGQYSQYQTQDKKTLTTTVLGMHVMFSQDLDGICQE